MIKKFRPIPNEILKLEALLRRLIMNYPDRNNLEKELAKSYAGFRGEQALDYHIAQIPGNEHYIFQNLRLPHSQDSFFQIDLLLLSRKLFTIFEAKNLKGTIFIEQDQLIRTLEEKVGLIPQSHSSGRESAISFRDSITKAFQNNTSEYFICCYD